MYILQPFNFMHLLNIKSIDDIKELNKVEGSFFVTREALMNYVDDFYEEEDMERVVMSNHIRTIFWVGML